MAISKFLQRQARSRLNGNTQWCIKPQKTGLKHQRSHTAVFCKNIWKIAMQCTLWLTFSKIYNAAKNIARNLIWSGSKFSGRFQKFFKKQKRQGSMCGLETELFVLEAGSFRFYAQLRASSRLEQLPAGKL